MSAVALDPGPASDPARELTDRLGPLPSVLPALADLRAAARTRVRATGLPSRRSEAWRFSDLKPLLALDLDAPRQAPDDRVDVWLRETEAAGHDRMLFVDGRLDAARSAVGSLPEGAYVGSVGEYWSTRDAEARQAVEIVGGSNDAAFARLNAGYFEDGPAIVVPTGVALPRPVRILFWNGGGAAHPLTVIRCAEGAGAAVTVSFIGAGAGWTNARSLVELEPAARLSLYTIQDETPQAVHTGWLEARLGAGATLDGFLVMQGARMARQDVSASLAGSGAVCGYSGVYLLDQRQEAAVVTRIHHDAPGCRTREVFKGALADRAHGAFQGLIRVDPVAQQTDAFQQSRTLLLGERAVMDAKPELEIHADDVRCSHGATVGDLDETALFYLRSRGIDPDTARRLLIEAFLVDAVDEAAEAGLRPWLAGAIRARLERLSS